MGKVILELIDNINNILKNDKISEKSNMNESSRIALIKEQLKEHINKLNNINKFVNKEIEKHW